MGTLRGISFLRPSPKALGAVEEVLSRFQLEELASRRYRDLSEGQKQRVLLARVIVAAPEFAVLDEPTSAMDRLAEQSAYAGLDALRTTEGAAVLLVTHDLALARDRADRILFLDDVERRVHVGLPAEIFASRAFKARYGLSVNGADDV